MSEGQSFFDKAKDMAGGLKDKAMDMVDGDEGDNDDNPDAPETSLGDKLSDKADSAQDSARNAADRMGGDDQGLG